jgi:hypothetical protein
MLGQVRKYVVSFAVVILLAVVAASSHAASKSYPPSCLNLVTGADLQAAFGGTLMQEFPAYPGARCNYGLAPSEFLANGGAVAIVFEKATYAYEFRADLKLSPHLAGIGDAAVYSGFPFSQIAFRKGTHYVRVVFRFGTVPTSSTWRARAKKGMILIARVIARRL